MKKNLQAYLLLTPLLVGSMVFYVCPFILVIRYSLIWGSGKNVRFVGLDNYQKSLSSETFRLAFGNTLRFLAISLPCILLLSYAIALLLKGYSEKHKVLKSVFLFPYLMPVVGTVTIIDMIFSESGLLNQALSFFGIPAADWLNSSSAFWIVLLLYLWKNTGYSVILLLAGLVTIPGDQYESAEMDGATSFQKFWYITTPQMWYSVFFAVIFSLINAFKCFREIFLIGGKHPDDSVYMLQHYLNNSFSKLNYDKLSVASVLLLLVIVIFFSAFYVFVNRKEEFRE